MDERYEKWIANYYPTRAKAMGDCAGATQKMVEDFPELIRVAGWLNGYEHFWCETKEGEVIDPTLVQYPNLFLNGGIRIYKKFKPGDEVRTGKCLDCGSDIYRKVQSLDGSRDYFCNESCEEAYRKYVESHE